ncbi:MAG: crossover junction endodeoxyribonuclease RuvC [Planctomycetota bacterium]|nr:MAG: crossover junction endodeoxyribonuclease RuvC [Planctomycetota bacterium]
MGVDPGLNRTGYAVLRRTPRGPALCEAGIISTRRGSSLAERVHEIVVGLRQLFEDYRPDVLAVEQVFSLVRNPKSALLMAHARGGILLTAVDYGVPVVHYTPTQVKRLLTGSGRASKEQIQRAVQNELNLPQLPEPHDVADAFAVALCHYYSRRVCCE